VAWCIQRAQSQDEAIVHLMPVHGMVSDARVAKYRAAMNTFDVIAPDGQPVRWALNFFHKCHLDDRVYGPELTMRLCRAAAARGVAIYLYGATTEVLEALTAKPLREFPSISISGVEPPPFRALTAQEDAAAIQRINDSGAGLVFLGLGCPKQELFAYEHRESIRAVQLCVGAAFDFHAGNKKIAPGWMQRRGLEWLFRLCQEPRRLWKRYLVTNTLFLLYFAGEMLFGAPAAAEVDGDHDALPAGENAPS